MTVRNHRNLVTDRVEIKTATGAASDRALWVLVKPMQQVTRVTAVSTGLAPQEPRGERLSLIACFSAGYGTAVSATASTGTSSKC